MYAFQLWREFKLSLAEIYTFFPAINIIHASKDVCVLDNVPKSELLKKVQHMWGVIRLIELIPNYKWKADVVVVDNAKTHEWKYRYGISSLWGAKDLKKVLMDTKRSLKNEGISARFVNKNFSTLNTAQVISEWLIERWTDFIVISTWDLEYFGRSIWIQDIDSYTKRDYWKTRDMQVGMLPPKLAQIMINIGNDWKEKNTSIYDPFCWLWTVLIESMLMWNTEVYGSDISSENIEKTKQNINFTRKNFENNLKTSQFQVLDAKGISSSPFLKKSDIIVTEWYLGSIFQKYSVTEKKIDEEKQKLLDIYEKFFFWLQKANFTWNIVISFPFWDIRGKYYYFSEIYAIINKYCKILPQLPAWLDFGHTKSGSLLYKRPDQVVGREIFKIKIRK